MLKVTRCHLLAQSSLPSSKSHYSVTSTTCNMWTRSQRRSPTQANIILILCRVSSSSGAQVQPGPVREQALPGPGEDREEQQARGPDPSQDPRLERRHGSRRGLLWRARGVQHRLVSGVDAPSQRRLSAVALTFCDPSQPPPCLSEVVTTVDVVSD